MRLRHRVAAALIVSALLASCGGRARSPGTSSGAGPISRAEMERARYASLFDVVQALRARWLQPRGPNTLIGRPTEIQVVIDDVRMGGVEVLRTLTTANVVTIAFVDPIAASQRWGGRHVQGTIVVTTRADGTP